MSAKHRVSFFLICLQEQQVKYRLGTSTEVTKLVIHQGTIDPKVNNQLSYRVGHLICKVNNLYIDCSTSKKTNS